MLLNDRYLALRHLEKAIELGIDRKEVQDNIDLIKEAMQKK